LPLAALWLVSATAAATTVYKWVDETGVTHYRDQPHPLAQKVEVQSAQSFQSASPAAATTGSSASRAASARTYSLCELYRPEQDEVFLNTTTLTVKLRVEPRLATGDQVAVALDGKRLTNQPTTGTEFVLTEVERGTHSLFIVIADARGNALCTTPAVTFHVRQPSKQAPVKAVRPKF
jgi:hypothetical protein